MEFIYPIFISFLFIFISELGDKTQLIVLSFSNKLKFYTILIGVGLGTFLSHGFAILFGSILGTIENEFWHNIFELITYLSFIAFGLFTFFHKEKDETNTNFKLSKKFPKLAINYIFIIAFTIAIGELGDKTFLASIGLGIEYPQYKISLIIGAILGMIASNSLAIILGKFLSTKIPDKGIKILSGTLFLIFGFIGLFTI